MRLAVTFLLLAAPFAALAQAEDPRFAPVVPFDAPYLSLADLASTVTKTTGVKVNVERGIADRKVAIFADEQKLGEVMKRVADTLFLEWEVEGDGYRLRLNPEVAREEAAVTAAEERLEREGMLRSIRIAIAHGKKSLAMYREGYRQARADYDESRRDQSEAGKKRSAALIKALMEEYPRQDKRELWDRGRVLAQLSEGQIKAMLNGQPIFASTAKLPGVISMPADSVGLLKENGITSSIPPKGLLLIGFYDPAKRGLIFRYREIGLKDGGLSTYNSVEPLSDYYVLAEIGAMPLGQRLTEWAKVKEESVLAKRLEREVEPPKAHPTDLMTLSDALRWVHRKTGVPVVADAFRVATGYADFASGGTIREFLRGLTPPAYGPITPLPPLVRAEGGWLSARHGRYWRRLRGEVPERLIAPMEQKAAKGRLTMDDYGSFALNLSPEQGAAVRAPETFLVDFPTYALTHGLSPLKLWGSLSPGMRETARTRGLPLRNLQGAPLNAAREVIADQMLQSFPGEEWLEFLLSTNGGLPDGSILHVDAATAQRGMGFNADLKIARPNESYSMFTSSFEGWFFSMGRPENFTIQASVPLYPIKRL